MSTHPGEAVTLRICHGTDCAVIDDPDGVADENALWPITVEYVPGATETLVGDIPRATVRAANRANAASPDYLMVRATDLGDRMKHVVDPSVEWDAACQLLDDPGRSTMALLLHPSLLPAVFPGVGYPPPAPGAEAWQLLHVREWWDDTLSDAVDAGADPVVAARRAVIFSFPQDDADFERILADVASWDALPEAVTPKQISEALTAGLSAAETSSILSTPDGQARIAALAALRTVPSGSAR